MNTAAMMIRFFIAAAIKESIKNKKAKKEFKAVALEVYTDIGNLFIDDADFHPELEK